MNKTYVSLAIKIIVFLGIVALGICIFMVDFNIANFKVYTPQTLGNEYSSYETLIENLSSTKSSYESSISAVETSKENFSKQKNEYEAISDETIDIIKEATTSEKYNIEYMWIKLGNYAKKNNLTLTLVEPGGKLSAPSEGDKTENKDSQVNSSGSSTTTPDVNTSSNEFMISVKGNYTNVSSFIFELENDKELRFKLDKIKMEYSGNNLITASFAVKNLVFKK